MIYTIITGFILSGKGVAFGIIVSLLIVFGVLAIAWVILNESRKEKEKKLARATFRSEPELVAPETARLLQTGKFEPVPSVVDATTELLHVEATSKKG